MIYKGQAIYNSCWGQTIF